MGLSELVMVSEFFHLLCVSVSTCEVPKKFTGCFVRVEPDNLKTKCWALCVST